MEEAEKEKENLKIKIIESPSKRYQVHVTQKQNGPGFGDYTHARIYRMEPEQTLITEFDRNYSSLHHSFFSFRGHEWFQSGRTYQSQLFVNLDTGDIYDTFTMTDRQVTDSLADQQKHGYETNFCWAAIEGVIESAGVLIVDGCFWACSYEYVCYDFSDPSRGPQYLPIDDPDVYLDSHAIDATISIKGDTMIYTREEQYSEEHGEYVDALFCSDLMAASTAQCESCRHMVVDKRCNMCIQRNAECLARVRALRETAINVVMKRYVLKKEGNCMKCIESYDRSEEDHDDDF